MMLQQLPAEDQKNFQDGKRIEEEIADSRSTPVGCFFAGTNLIHWVFDAISESINSIFDKTLTYNCAYVVEDDPDTMDFLINEFGDEISYYFEKVADMKSATNRDKRSDRIVQIPHCVFITLGFICKSDSPENNSSHNNKGCIQDKKEKSGESFQDSKVAIESLRPEKFLAENLKVLEHVLISKEFSSDSDYIKQQFAEIGYWVDSFIVQASDYGSFADRQRWLCYGQLFHVKCMARTLYIEQLLNKLKLPQFELEEFELDEETIGNFKGGMPPRQKKFKTEKEEKYEDKHAAAFAMNDFPWPPMQGDLLRDLGETMIYNLNQRPLECIYFINRKFPPVFEHGVREVVEFIDVNRDLPRITGPLYERNPWTLNVKTIVCKTLLIKRTALATSKGMEVKFELKDGLELMQLQGWDIAQYQELFDRKYDSAFLTKLSGNAFNAFKMMAMVIASTAASALKDPEQEAIEVKTEEDSYSEFSDSD